VVSAKPFVAYIGIMIGGIYELHRSCGIMCHNVEIRRFGDRILSLSSGGAYPVGPKRRSWALTGVAIGVRRQTGSVYWLQLGEFHLKTEAEPGPPNVRFSSKTGRWITSRHVALCYHTIATKLQLTATDLHKHVYIIHTNRLIECRNPCIVYHYVSVYSEG
jgi:hypothetical protein